MSLPYRIEIKGYCENCAWFSPELDSTVFTTLGNATPKIAHVVFCKNSPICERVANFVAQVAE